MDDASTVNLILHLFWESVFMEKVAIAQLGQLVYNYCGLNYLDNLSTLEMKVIKRIKELNLSTWNYLSFIESNPLEWDVLTELLTINETYFYREDKQLNVFREKVLKELDGVNSEEPIKVWSAACSSGEEPYSLAMMALDSEITRTCKIQGTDINKRVLQIGEKGAYSKRSLSFRRVPDRLLKTYFDDQGDLYSLKQSVRDMVTFKRLNLLDELSMSAERGYDVIFCRNVLIYFDSETIKKVVTSFHHSLKKGGYLFLGHAENISNMGLDFETISTNGTFYYRKG